MCIFLPCSFPELNAPSLVTYVLHDDALASFRDVRYFTRYPPASARAPQKLCSNVADS